MDIKSEYSHLDRAAKALLESSDEERIRAIRAGTWIDYPRATEIMSRLEELLLYPKVTRMPNLLLVAPSFNGKSSILERFVSQHPPVLDPELEVAQYPVLMIDAPSGPNISAFYIKIFDKLMVPYRPSASPAEKNSQAKTLFVKLGVKMLIIDEIHNLIAGGLKRQREFRNELKGLGNDAKIVIVASGTEDAYNAFNIDPQMSSRFPPEELPLWRFEIGFGWLVAFLERSMPLKRASNLKNPEISREIFQRSEGTLGDICDLCKELAVHAIRDKSEQITVDSIQKMKWVPPSKRKQRQRQ